MNGIKLFRVFGITVYMHWSWLVMAAFVIETRKNEYHLLLWNVLEYLLLFAIVLLHEFGHALACRSVGGRAERIMLWPLGGVAFVSPPPRPGALLWSIAAGPLVNVVLLLISLPLVFLHLPGDAGHLVETFAWINAGLLIFNLLPIYPLDGGQILQSLLWFLLGRGRSMAVATIIGAVGAVALGLLALYEQNYWIGLIAFFVAYQCWAGWKVGAQIRRRENARPRPGFACPTCGRPPIVGKFWRCAQCNTAFDAFETDGTCPSCGNTFQVTDCAGCRNRTPIQAWRQPVAVSVPPTPFITTASPMPGRSGLL